MKMVYVTLEDSQYKEHVAIPGSGCGDEIKKAAIQSSYMLKQKGLPELNRKTDAHCVYETEI